MRRARSRSDTSTGSDAASAESQPTRRTSAFGLARTTAPGGDFSPWPTATMPHPKYYHYEQWEVAEYNKKLANERQAKLKDDEFNFEFNDTNTLTGFQQLTVGFCGQ